MYLKFIFNITLSVQKFEFWNKIILQLNVERWNETGFLETALHNINEELSYILTFSIAVLG
jgi:hypothetical protein